MLVLPRCCCRDVLAVGARLLLVEPSRLRARARPPAVVGEPARRRRLPLCRAAVAPGGARAVVGTVAVGARHGRGRLAPVRGLELDSGLTQGRQLVLAVVG